MFKRVNAFNGMQCQVNRGEGNQIGWVCPYYKSDCNLMAVGAAKNHHNYFITIALFVIFLLITQVVSPSCSVSHCNRCRDSDSNKCRECDSGYYEANNQCCADSNANCNDCSNSPTVCEDCKGTDKYFIENGLCVLCNVALSHCETCSNNTTCLTCDSSQYKVNTTHQCESCQDLLTACVKCSDANTCTQCANNSYVVDSATNQCILCREEQVFCLTCKSQTVCTSCQVITGIVLINSECLSCNTTMIYCLDCTTKFNCTRCQTYYAPIPQSNCVLCSSVIYGCIECSSSSRCTLCRLGNLINGGCTSIVGCVDLATISSAQSFCNICNTTLFQEIPVNGLCKCLVGHLAGLICSTMTGCISAMRNSSGQFCLTCNMSGQFILEQGRCICKPKYYLGGETCLDICGDGYLMNLPCDDGNLMSDDGCSSSCQVEQNYRCNGGSFTSKSMCYYRGRVNLVFVSVKKVEYENKAVVKFTTSPQFKYFYQMNHNDRLNFTTEANCTVTDTYFIGPYIYLYVDYFQNMDGKVGTYSIIYDENYIVSPPSKVSFQFYDLNKISLNYDNNTTPKKEGVELCMLILSILALAVFFIGSYAHKMIGVETIHTFHIIFISQALTSNNSSLMTNFKQMSYALGSSRFLFGFADSDEVIFKRLNYENDLYYNFILVAAIQIFVLLTAGAIKIMLKILEKYRYRSSVRLQIIKRTLEKLEVLLYDFLIFPMFIGFMYHFTLSLSRHSFPSRPKTFQPVQYESLIIISTILTCAFIIFSELKPIFLSQSPDLDFNLDCKSNYVPFYLIYTIFLSLLLQMEVSSILSKPYLFLGIIIGVQTVFLIAYRPYTAKIHNFSIIFYQIGICLSMFWLFYDSLEAKIRLVEQIICYIQLAWLFMVVIVAIVRAIYEIRRRNELSKGAKISKKVKKSAYSDEKYQQGLREAILQQQSLGVNPFRILAQQQRSLYSQHEQYNKKRNEYKLNKIAFKDQLKNSHLINHNKRQIPHEDVSGESKEDQHFTMFKKQLRQKFKQTIPTNMEGSAF